MEIYRLNDAVQRSAFLQELDRLWSGLQDDPKLRADAESAGIELVNLPNRPAGEFFRLASARKGIAPPNEFIVDGTAWLATKIIYDVWKAILWPRLKRRFGNDVLAGPRSAGTKPKPRPKAPTRASAKSGGKDIRRRKSGSRSR